MANVFNHVQGLHPKRNAFSADTYRNDFTAPLGVNIPCYVQHVMPATRIKCSASALVRLQALIAPVMDNIDYYVHFWKLPYRLLENDRFTAFISGEKDASEYDALFVSPEEVVEVVVEQINNHPIINFYSGDKKVALWNCIFGNGSLFDFLGYDRSLFGSVSSDDENVLIFNNDANNTKLNWRGFLAYFMLHENWYMNENVPYFEKFVDLVDSFVKDQDLISFAKLVIESALMNTTLISNVFTTHSGFLPHGWEKDYFTSALPNVQFGDPVTLPLGGSAPGVINPAASFIDIPGNLQLSNTDGISGSPSSNNSLYIVGGRLVNRYFDEGTQEWINNPVLSLSGESSFLTAEPSGIHAEDDDGNTVAPIIVDLGEASAISINELRFANALQVFKERQLRYGRRRLEYYKGFFDVSPEDLRLQVPKYLGGGRIPINISDIEQTSATSGSNALGHLAGKATAVAGGFAGFSTFCSEESIIVGIAFAMPHITYANGMSRFNLKTNDIYDYYNPSFQHLGEQAIKKIEIYAGTDDPDGDFGYTPRYTEYRFHSNEMHGEFKDSLSYWSLGRIFSSTPALNAQFIYMQPAVFDRIFAVSGQPNMVVSMLFHVKSIKPISKYGTPMLLA